MKTTSQELRKEIILSYIDAYNQFDVDGMVKNLSPHVSFESRVDGEANLSLENKTQFVAQAQKAAEIFRNRKMIPSNWHYHEDRVEVDIAFAGTLAIDFMTKAQGATLRVNGQSTFYFKGNEIVKIVDSNQSPQI